MRKRIRNKLIIIIIVNFCFFSVLFSIGSIRIKNLESKSKLSDNYDNILNDLNLSVNYSPVFIIDSSEKSILLEPTKLFEAFLDLNDCFYFMIISISEFLVCEFRLIFKNTSSNSELNISSTNDIGGVDVSGEEMLIFNLIQEFLDGNRAFSKEKVALYIKSLYRLNGNFNYNGIKAVIDMLLIKNLIVEGSKLTRKTVLLNSNRKQIYEVIRTNPGIYKNKLAIKLNFSNYLIKWHISMLIKFSLIREYNFNDNIAYFDSLSNPKNDLIFLIISKEKCSKIIEFLKKSKHGSTKNQISKEMKVHYNTITKYLESLEKFNLLIRKIVNNKEILLLNNEAIREIKDN